MFTSAAAAAAAGALCSGADGTNTPIPACSEHLLKGPHKLLLSLTAAIKCLQTECKRISAFPKISFCVDETSFLAMSSVNTTNTLYNQLKLFSQACLSFRPQLRKVTAMCTVEDRASVTSQYFTPLPSPRRDTSQYCEPPSPHSVTSFMANPSTRNHSARMNRGIS